MRARWTLLTAMAIGTTGCLITGPVGPVSLQIPTEPPFFTFFQPNSPNTTLPNNSTPQTFIGRANDAVTPTDELVYEWFLDGSGVLGPAAGNAAAQYSNSGSAIGAVPPNHVLEELVSNAANLSTNHTWNITVQ